MKTKKFVLIVAILVIAICFSIRGYIKCAYSQTLPPVWSQQFGTVADDEALAISVDGQNNVFVAGSTDGNFFTTNMGGTNAFLSRYNPDGNIAWSKQFGTGISDFITSIALDSIGNIYVGGSTQGNLFNNNLGGEDAFIIKYNPLGSQIWAKQFGTNTDDRVCALSVDHQDNVIAVGFTKGSLYETNTGPDVNGNPVSNSFVVKYNSSGSQLWGHQFGADNDDAAAGVSSDTQGNIYITGSTSVGSAKTLFGPVAGIADAYLVKYSTGGVVIWGQQFGAAGANISNSICVDANGFIYIGGSENVTKDAGNDGSAFVCKFDSNGSQLWTQAIGSYGEVVNRMALDSQGNLVVSGNTKSNLFGPAAGDQDIFLMKYSSSGNVLWQEQEGTSARDSVSSLASDSLGNIYLAGITRGSLFAVNSGGEDGFIERVNSSGAIASSIPTHFSPYKPLLFAWARQTVTLSYPPVLANRQPYVYAGYLCSGIPGAKVHQTASRQIVIEGPSKQVILTPGSLTYQINGKARKMSAKPVMVSNRCYVPLDVMKAVLPYPVHYDAKAQTVHFDPPRKKVATR